MDHKSTKSLYPNFRVKYWNGGQVRDFISNFKTGIPQNQEEQRRHLLENLPMLMAVVDRAIHLKRNITIRDTQWVSILLFLLTENKGLLEQVSTGEGKSLIIVVLATIKALYGNKVDIITSSHILAKRDASENEDIYQLLQVTAGHNCSDETTERKMSYKENQVVYGEMGMFQRDLLLDRFYDKSIRGDRKFDYIIVDEVDSMVLDKGKNVLYLSHDIPGMETLTPLFVKIWTYVHGRGFTGIKQDEKQVYEAVINDMHGLVRDIDIKEALQVDGQRVKEETVRNVKRYLQGEGLLGNDGRILKHKAIRSINYNLSPLHLTKKQRNSIRAILRISASRDIQLKIPRHLQHFVERYICIWIHNAFRARSMVEEDHYFIGHDLSEVGQVEGPTAIIMDKDTGTEQYYSHWNDGLHQFLQLKHGCAVQYESLKAVFMSNIRYLQEYGCNIYGLTGTLGSRSETELLMQLYQVEFANIPSFKPSQFLEDVTLICKDEDEQRSKLRQTADKMLKDGRPVLVIAENIRKVDSLRKAFDNVNTTPGTDTGYDIFTYKHSYEKLDVFDAEKGLEKPCVILATNLAGRGSDLKINETMNQAGDLHVILTYLPNNRRIEEQAFGRSARKGQHGSGQLIIIGKKTEFNVITMKVKRDELERKRIGEINQRYQTHIKIEENLFDSFTNEFKKIQTEVGKDAKGKAKRAREKVFSESCLYKWALWLDRVNDLLKTDRQLVDDKYRNFLNKLKKFGKIHESIACPALKLKLAKIYVDEKRNITTQLFDDIIQSDPEFAEAAHYYKAHWFIKCQKDKEDVFKELQKARDLFSSRIVDNTSNTFLVNMISQHYTKNTVHSFTPTKGFEDQMNHINQIYQTFIVSIDIIVGKSINETMLKTLTVSTEDAKSQGLEMKEKVQKIPGDPYQAKLLSDALAQCEIVQPNCFGKTCAESAETKTILWSQYRYDTHDILRKLQSFKDGQSLCPEDLKYAMADGEEFWEMVTEKHTRQHYILVNKESLMKINFAYSNVPKIFEDTIPAASRDDVFQRSGDTKFLYLIPKEVDPQQITADRFLIYSKKTLDSCIIKFLKELNLYVEIGIGMLKKELGTTPIARYDSIEMHDLKMIEGMTDEQAEGILQQLVGNGIITSNEPYRISEAALNDLESISLADHAEFRKEVIEVIFHCFKYRFALAKSGRVHGRLDGGNNGIEDIREDSMPVRKVPDFMEFSPHVGLFQNLLQMHVIEQRKIKNDIKEEKHLDNFLSTLLQTWSMEDYAILTDLELYNLMNVGNKGERILQQLETNGWIEKSPSKNLRNTYLITALPADISEIGEHPVRDALVKNLLFSKLKLMSKSDTVAKSVLSWQGQYLKLKTLDSFLENLEERFHAEDIPHKMKTIMIFKGIGLNSVIKLEEKKWTRSSIVNMVTIFVIGLAQLAVGIVVEILSHGTLTHLAHFFFSEGLGDIMFAVQCTFRGHCSWKEYGKMKAISLAVFFVTCGFGASFRQGAQVPRSAITLAIAKRFPKEIYEKVAADKLKSLMFKFMEHHYSFIHLKKIFKTVQSTVLEKVNKSGINEKLVKLTRQIGPHETRVIVNRMNKEIMDAPGPHESFGIMKDITDKVGNLVTFLTDAINKGQHSRTADSEIKMVRFALHLINRTDQGIVCPKELAKLIEVFLDIMDSKLEDELDRFENQDEIFHRNDVLEEDIRQKWDDLLVEKIDDKFANEVVIPLSKYFESTLGKMCTQAAKSQYRETQFNQYRRIVDATLENSQDAMNQREGPDIEEASVDDKSITQHYVQDSAKMTLRRNIEDMMHETHDPDLMATMCMYDTPLPILFATPLAVILGRPIVVRDLDGKILRTFSHYGAENATPIEITYKKGHSKEPIAHFYSTEFEDPRENKKNPDCILRAFNVAVASDEVISREVVGDILKTDNHLRDLIVKEIHDSSEVGQVDNDTGTEQHSSQWNDSLHQFLQPKHGHGVGYESLKALSMSNIRHLQKYGCHIYGLTEAIGMRKDATIMKGKCPMIMSQNFRRIIATVTQGEARILQAPDSDVSLHIPKGSLGLFTLMVHTDHTRFPGVIPDGECIISPLVEVEHKKLSDEATEKELPLHFIRIPHKLKNTSGYQTVRVRKVNKIGNEILYEELQEFSETANGSNVYEIDKKFITIFTTKFSSFICTSCQNSCQATVMLFLLGYLEPRQEANDTLTQIKSFICSDLYRIKDFREVGANDFQLCYI